MEIRAEEISEIIRKQIKEYGKEVEVSETGTIISGPTGMDSSWPVVRHSIPSRTCR